MGKDVLRGLQGGKAKTRRGKLNTPHKICGFPLIYFCLVVRINHDDDNVSFTCSMSFRRQI